MDDREIPRDDVSHPRERMNDVAAELARRAKPSYLKDRAKGAVKEKAVQVKDRTLESPIALGILGGLATAAIVKLINRRRHTTELEEGYEFYDTSPLPSEPAPEPGRTEELRKKLDDKMAAVREKVDDLRERIPSGAEIKQTAAEIKDAVAEQSPIVLGLGAIALGAALGLLLPVSDKEREVLSPYRRQMHDKVDALKDKVGPLGEKIETRILGKHNGGHGTPPTIPPTSGFPTA